MIIKFFRKSKTLTKALVLYYFIIDRIQHIQNGEQAHMATQKNKDQPTLKREKFLCLFVCFFLFHTTHTQRKKNL